MVSTNFSLFCSLWNKETTLPNLISGYYDSAIGPYFLKSALTFYAVPK